MAKATRKHVYLYDMHIEVLDEIISTHEDISNYSEAVRHLCMMYDPKIEEKINPIQIKLNAMGKEISILTEMVSEFADLHLKDTGILIGTNSTVYQEAKERVEGKIKANQTKKYSSNIKKTTSESVTTKSEVFDPTRFLKR